jgi:3-methyladenine DNA glycosylase AlkD
MHFIAEEISHRLSPLANGERAVGAKAYMRNQFEFIGIATPQRRKVCKEFMKQIGLLKHDDLQEAVKELWQLPEREYQYCAIELIAFNKKVWNEKVIELIEHCIVQKSWWDTVDFICTECVSPYFKIFSTKQKEITNGWNKSTNIWLQRSSLLAQKGYKKNTDTEMLSEYIIHLSKSKEFFIQKAIGWMLREHARVDAEWVINFVSTHELAPLSKREALKHYPKESI